MVIKHSVLELRTSTTVCAGRSSLRTWSVTGGGVFILLSDFKIRNILGHGGLALHGARYRILALPPLTPGSYAALEILQ